jgi:predicted kinase
VSRKPLHVVCGPPACGKSVYGRALAGRLEAAFLDSDTATELVVQAGLTAAGLSADDRDSPDYKVLYRQAVYETLFALAEENLPNVPVVMAGPFTRESQDADWAGWLAERFGTEVEVHFVWVAPKVRRERMMARGVPRDLAKLENWEAYLATCAQERPPFPHVFVGG